MKAHFQGVTDYWKGTSFDGKSSGQGFRSYLNAVESGPALVTSTETQVNAVQTSLLQVNGQANALFAAADPKLEALNTELQKLTRYYKSDMSSILGIAITFASNDGD
jgi:predicted lipoprotein